MLPIIAQRQDLDLPPALTPLLLHAAAILPARLAFDEALSGIDCRILLYIQARGAMLDWTAIRQADIAAHLRLHINTVQRSIRRLLAHRYLAMRGGKRTREYLGRAYEAA